MSVSNKKRKSKQFPNADEGRKGRDSESELSMYLHHQVSNKCGWPQDVCAFACAQDTHKCVLGVFDKKNVCIWPAAAPWDPWACGLGQWQVTRPHGGALLHTLCSKHRCSNYCSSTSSYWIHTADEPSVTQLTWECFEFCFTFVGLIYDLPYKSPVHNSPQPPLNLHRPTVIKHNW